MKRITVSDFTLKAAQQQELALAFREKLAIAEKLDLAGLNAIELPALGDSKENEVISRTIASAIKNATVKIPVGNDVDSVKVVAECIKHAVKPCLQVALPISTAQMEYFYHLKAPLMLSKITELVSASRAVCDCVEFVALDAFRAEDGFVESCVKTAIEAGATAITVCDDAGEALPEDCAKLVKKVKGVCPVTLYVQVSDALSLATANAIASINAGADGVKTSATGKYLSVAVLSDVMRAKKFELGLECDIDITKAKTISCDISDTVDSQVKDNDGYVDNSVINSTATLKDISNVVKQLGYELSDSDNGKVYEEFKKVTAKKESIDKKELEAIVASTAMQVPSTYHLINYVVNSGNIIPATANITLEKDGEKITGVSTGDGPIDAAFHAIEQVIGHHYELDEFQVQAVTKGRGAVGSSIIRLRADGKLYPGNGVSTDIVGACIRAYINALNKIVYEGK